MIRFMVGKKRVYILSVLLLGVLCLKAENFDVDAQIEKIKRVKDHRKRVELMNELKRHLVRMNEEQREAAIEKLRRQKERHHAELQRDAEYSRHLQEQMHESSGESKEQLRHLQEHREIDEMHEEWRK